MLYNDAALNQYKYSLVIDSMHLFSKGSVKYVRIFNKHIGLGNVEEFHRILFHIIAAEKGEVVSGPQK
jgi:hypothetical protein